MPDVFISYSTRADADEERREMHMAERLEVALEDRGVSVWRDEGRIVAGDLVTPALERAILGSRLVVALVSANHQASNICRWEVLYALAYAAEGTMPVLPVLRTGHEGLNPYPAGFFEEHAARWDGGDARLEAVCDAVQRALISQPPSGEAFRLARGQTFGIPGITGSRFVGRLDLLMKLYSTLLSGFAGPNAAQVDQGGAVLLQGEPGMGKSSLAAFFAEQFASRFEAGVLWLDAAGDRVDAAVEDEDERDLVLTSLADGVQAFLRARYPAAPPPKDGGARTRWRDVRQELVTQLDGDRVLVVVDDVPQGMRLADVRVDSPNVTTIFTSRGLGLANQGVRPVAVGQLADEESLLLLENSRDPDRVKRLAGLDVWDGERHTAKALAEQVGHHPMAVDLLGLRLQDPSTSPQTLLDEVRAIAAEFIDVQEEWLPLEHRASILATVSTSLRSGARGRGEKAVVRALAVTPAGRPIDHEALTESLAVPPLDAAAITAAVDALQVHGVLCRTESDDRPLVTQHQIVQFVARHVWEEQSDPFAADDPARPAEPDLSLRLAGWHHRGGEDLRNIDDLLAADVHSVAGHILDGAAAVQPLPRTGCVHRAYAHLAQARTLYRAKIVPELPRALRDIDAAVEVLRPHAGDLVVDFATHTAEALRGLVLGDMARDVAQAESALQVLIDADTARQEIADVVLAMPEGHSPLPHDYVREVLGRSQFNIPGRSIPLVKTLLGQRPDGWANRARDALLAGEKAHEEVLNLRRGLYADRLDQPSPILSFASSHHGIATMAYFRALLPADREARAAEVTSRLDRLREGLILRCAAGNEADVTKSLHVLLKVMLARIALENPAHPGTTRVGQAERLRRATQDLSHLEGRPYRAIGQDEGAARHLRDDLHDQVVDGLMEWPHTTDVVGLSQKLVEAATTWLVLARLTGSAGAQPANPALDDFFDEERGWLLEDWMSA